MSCQSFFAQRLKPKFFLAFLVSFFGFGLSLAADSLKLAVTTTTYDSGFIESLLKHYPHQKIRVVAFGSSQALAVGERGDVDVVFSHAPEREKSHLKKGHFSLRKEVMFNHFLLLGSKENPLGLQPKEKLLQALQRVANHGGLFLSRGDNSGIHLQELRFWEVLGINPKKERWYMETGQGMASTIRIGYELGAYLLSDTATFHTSRYQKHLHVYASTENQERNLYSLLVVNPKKHPHTNHAASLRFVTWMTSPKIQRWIGAYTKEGRALFYPLLQK